MSQFIHFDEARSACVRLVRGWLAKSDGISVLLITDLFGKMRLVLRPGGNLGALSDEISNACGVWWSGEIFSIEDMDDVSRGIFEPAFNEGTADEQEPRLLLLDRHRTRTAWFGNPIMPPWEAPKSGPPVVVFYSFKGGLGRSTLLAAFAIQRARAGQRVCVVDMDLDSPGVGSLLSADASGVIAPWGCVDFMLEYRAEGVQFADYWHRCDRIGGAGEVRVMPAGILDEDFPGKLARVDLEEAPSARETALWNLLASTHAELKPDWILIDARTGISEPSGHLLSGIAHLHVLLGTFQEQSWLGLERVLDRLGKDRVLADIPQADVLVVQAMVPIGEPGKWAKEAFAGRAETSFEDRYYATDDSDEDRFWTVGDKQAQDAPHVPLPIHYDPRLASFADIADVADALSEGAYAEIGARIAGRFLTETGE